MTCLAAALLRILSEGHRTMNTMTTGVAAFLTILTALLTSAVAHEGHDHSHGSDEKLAVPNRNQPSGTVINEAPPFGTLPPGHSPNDGHDHSGHDHGQTNQPLPSQPSPIPNRVDPRTNQNPYYPSPTQSNPNFNRDIGRYDQSPVPNFTPRQDDFQSWQSSPQMNIPGHNQFDLRDDGCRSGYGCSSRVSCPLATGRQYESAPIQYFGYSNSPYAEQHMHAYEPVGNADDGCAAYGSFHSCPLGH